MPQNPCVHFQQKKFPFANENEKRRRERETEREREREREKERGSHLFPKISCRLLSSLAQNFNEASPDHLKASVSFPVRKEKGRE